MQKGQTLIEVLVSLATTVVVMTSIVFAVIAALHNNEFSKNQNLATQYAQQGLEILRNMRNTNYSNFMSLGNASCYCIDTSCTVINSNPVSNPTNLCGRKSSGCDSSCPNDPNVGGIFSRYAYLEKNSLNCPVAGNTDVMEAIVYVTWQDSKCPQSKPYCHNVQVSTCLSNLNGLPVVPIN